MGKKDAGIPLEDLKSKGGSGELYSVFDHLIDPFAVVHAAGDSLEKAASFRISYVNIAAADFLKLDGAKVSGKDLSVLFPLKQNARLFHALHEFFIDRSPKKITSMPYKIRRGKEILKGRFDISISAFNDGAALNWKENTLAEEKAERKDYKELLHTLELERTWFNSVMAQMPSGVSIAEAPSGKLLYHNEQGIKIIGHTLIPTEDYKGYAKYGAMHDPETPYSPEEYPLARALFGETVLGEEMLYRRGDGTFTYLSVNSAPVKNSKGEIIAAVSTFDDIGRTKKVEAEAEESKRILDALMESVPEGITIADSRNVNIHMVSRYGMEKLGGEHQGLTANAVAEKWKVFYPDGVTEMETENLPLVRAIEKGQEVTNFELIQVNSKGDALHLLCNAAPIRSKTGEITGGIVAWRDITERKIAEKSLRESEARYKELASALELERGKLATIIDNLPVGVGISDPKGSFLSFNKTGQVIHGFSPGGEIEYPSLDEYMNMFNVFYTDGKPMSLEEWPVSRAVKGEFVKNFELQMYNKLSGVERILSYSLAPVHNSEGDLVLIVFVMQDITDSKKAEESLQAALQQLKFHVENSPLAVVEFNNEFKVTKWSGKAEEVFGWKAEEVLGRRIGEFRWVHEEDAEKVAALSAEMLASKKTSNTHINRNYRKDGAVIICEWYNSALVDANGDLVSVLSLVLDVTEKERTMKQLEQTLRNLERSNEELEQFAYVASHDLQEPLRMVSNYTQMLARKYRDKLDERAEQFIEFIIEGSRRMHDLIQDLLSFSRIATRGDNFTPTDLNLIMQNVIADLRVTIEENSAVIKYGDLPTVNADTTQIRQVFQNLVSNAIKFRGLDEPEVTISAERMGKNWLFAVKDNGIGISPEYFDKIFIIFQRLHDREAYPGTGIGLAICKRIIEHHGGNIWLESEEGKGASFYFTIPV